MEEKKSRELFERLAKVMPGASTRTVTHYDPFPIALERGQGCRLWDVDGNEYIDLLNNYTASWPRASASARPPSTACASPTRPRRP
jgi:glutamate-1-semialdehyde aminotransferase